MKINKSKKYKQSYGIIGFFLNPNKEINYLMVKKNYSYAFFDFIFGKYKLTDFFYIRKLISRMSKGEKGYLYTKKNFNDLWELFWKNKKFYKTAYFNGLFKFNLLKNGYYYNDMYFSLDDMLNNVTSNYLEVEWGFPKGTKENGENNIEAALREFTEETGIKKYHLLDLPYIQEKHMGMNGVLYITNLYFVLLDTMFINFRMIDKSEISKVVWFTKKTLNNTIRDYQSSIVKTIEHGEKIITENIDKLEELKKPLDIDNDTNNLDNRYKNFTHEDIYTDSPEVLEILNKKIDIEEAEKFIGEFVSKNINILCRLYNYNKYKVYYPNLILENNVTKHSYKPYKLKKIEKEDYSNLRMLFADDDDIEEKEDYSNLRMLFANDDF